MANLITIAERFLAGADEIAKPLGYYRVYDRYFAGLARKPLCILELGTYRGDSTKIFSRYFARSRLLSLDLHMRDIDFKDFKNVSSMRADQTDGAALDDICGRFAPGGFDIIIDDASHVGVHSLRSYEILFPKLRPGGFYVVEDWGTGYWQDWPDGGESRGVELADHVDGLPRRIKSHDHGMVGFVKHLVDETAGNDNRPSSTSPSGTQRGIEFLHVYPGLAILRKHP